MLAVAAFACRNIPLPEDRLGLSDTQAEACPGAAAPGSTIAGIIDEDEEAGRNPVRDQGEAMLADLKRV